MLCSLLLFLNALKALLDGTKAFIWVANFHTKGRLLYLSL